MLSREETQAKRDDIIKYILKAVFIEGLYGADNNLISISRRDLEEETYEDLMRNILREFIRRNEEFEYQTLQLGNNLIYDTEENSIKAKHCVLIKNDHQVRTKITIEYSVIKEYNNCIITTKDKEIKFTL